MSSDPGQSTEPEMDPETWREQVRRDFEKWRLEFEIYGAGKIAMFQAQIDFAKIAIKGITIVNGAAALALLAFLGHVVAAAADQVGKIPGADNGIKLSVAVDLMPAMIWFMAGTSAGVITASFSYFAQTMFTEFEENTAAHRWGIFFRFVAIGAAALGIGAFVTGGYMATDTFIGAFTERPPPPPAPAPDA